MNNSRFCIVLVFFFLQSAWAQNPPAQNPPAVKKGATPAATPVPNLKTAPPPTVSKKVEGPGVKSNYVPPTYISPSKLGGGRDLYDVPKVTILANKRFYLKDEITLEATYLATDPYDKYVALGGSYTHAFDDMWGWEVINGSYAFSFASGLKNDLVNNQGVNTSLIDYLQDYGTTNLVVSPLYTKNLAFNSRTVYSVFSMVVGGGVSFFAYGGFEPVLDAGIILRYFLGPNSSVKLDFRDYIFPNGYTNNNLSVSVGYAFDLHHK